MQECTFVATSSWPIWTTFAMAIFGLFVALRSVWLSKFVRDNAQRIRYTSNHWAVMMSAILLAALLTSHLQQHGTQLSWALAAYGFAVVMALIWGINYLIHTRRWPISA